MEFKIGRDNCEECNEEREFYQFTIDENRIRLYECKHVEITSGEKVIARFFLLKDGLIFLPRR